MRSALKNQEKLMKNEIVYCVCSFRFLSFQHKISKIIFQNEKDPTIEAQEIVESAFVIMYEYIRRTNSVSVGVDWGNEYCECVHVAIRFGRKGGDVVVRKTMSGNIGRYGYSWI